MHKILTLACAALLAGVAWASVPFEPVKDVTDKSAQQYYIYEMGNQVYVKVVGENITANSFTGDKFVFIEAGHDQYYIYNKSASAYIYYASPTGQSNERRTSASSVRLTTDKSQANTWKIVRDSQDPECYDIVPGCVDNVIATTEGWNFRGGKSYALNLYDRSDTNARWQILGNLSSEVPCATRVFSLPGQPFMHKLPTHDGDTLVRVTGLPKGLKLYERPNYKYVYGKAPKEGHYTYTLELSSGKTVDVQLHVSKHLAQPRPFMGILTWNAFRNYIDQDVILKLAEALETFGLRELGYDHMCIDDCWARHERTEDGHLDIDTDKFPSLTDLTAEMHRRGLKIGIYSDAGSYTCSGVQPGSFGVEDVDAQDFVKWGFDLLKYDFCNATGGTSAAAAEQAYSAMGRALDKAVREAGKQPEDFKFYMCEWGWRQPYLWAANTGASCWRATDDTRDFWSDIIYKGGVKQVIDIFKNIWAYQGVNRWNDADMLCVGLHGTGYPSNDGGGDGYPAGMTQDEYRTNFGLWCMFSSPLTLSNNITNLDGRPNDLTRKTITNTYYQEDLDIIRNRELIAIDQDPMGQGAEPVVETQDYIIFQKDLANGDVAFSITNLSREVRTITVDFRDLTALAANQCYKMRDLWQHQYICNPKGKPLTFKQDGSWSVTVPSHGTMIYRLIK